MTTMMISRTTAPATATIHHGNGFFGVVGGATSNATDGPSVKSSSGSICETASSRNEYDPGGLPGGTASWTTTCSAAFGAKSRTDSPPMENQSGFACSLGLVSRRPLSVCALVFVTVNGARAAPAESSSTWLAAAVTVKLGSADPPLITSRASWGADSRCADRVDPNRRTRSGHADPAYPDRHDGSRRLLSLGLRILALDHADQGWSEYSHPLDCGLESLTRKDAFRFRLTHACHRRNRKRPFVAAVPRQQPDDNADDDQQDDGADDDEDPPWKFLLLRRRGRCDFERDGRSLCEVLVGVDFGDGVQPERVRPRRGRRRHVELGDDLLGGVGGEISHRLADDREPLRLRGLARLRQQASPERLRARVRHRERRLSSPGTVEVHFLSGCGDCETGQRDSPPIRRGGFGSGGHCHGRARPGRPRAGTG